MIVKNHNNEDTEVETIKRIKNPNSVYYFIVKAQTVAGSTEIYPYDVFQEFNPNFKWEEN